MTKAVSEIFRDEGYRLKRNRARFKFLVADWGVERIPTFCVFELELDDVPRRGAYALRLSEGSSLPFDASFVEGGKPVTLTLR